MRFDLRIDVLAGCSQNTNDNMMMWLVSRIRSSTGCSGLNPGEHVHLDRLASSNALETISLVSWKSFQIRRVVQSQVIATFFCIRLASCKAGWKRRTNSQRCNRLPVRPAEAILRPRLIATLQLDDEVYGAEGGIRTPSVCLVPEVAAVGALKCETYMASSTFATSWARRVRVTSQWPAQLQKAHSNRSSLTNEDCTVPCLASSSNSRPRTAPKNSCPRDWWLLSKGLLESSWMHVSVMLTGCDDDCGGAQMGRREVRARQAPGKVAGHERASV
ncbi:hypothetical protein V8F33_002659 [Rhypophila sp. PSN 637]